MSAKRNAHKRRKAMKVGQALKIVAGQAKEIKSLRRAVDDLEAIVVEIMKRQPKVEEAK